MNPMPMPDATTTFVHHNVYVKPHNVSSYSVLHKPNNPKGVSHKPKTPKGGRKSMTRNRKYKRHSVKRTRRLRRGGNMFHGSYPEAPVVCLAGSGKIPCTAFSAA